MGCRCNERGEAITTIPAAIQSGDVKAIANVGAFVLKSTIEDAGSALKRAAITARARLRNGR